MTTSLIEPLLHERDAAKILGLSPAWLTRKRWEGGGPAFIRHGRAVRYELAEIRRWIESHRQVSPTQGC